MKRILNKALFAWVLKLKSSKLQLARESEKTAILLFLPWTICIVGHLANAYISAIMSRVMNKLLSHCSKITPTRKNHA